MAMSTHKNKPSSSIKTRTEGSTLVEVLIATFISLSVSVFLLSNYARTQYLLDTLKSTQQGHQTRLVQSKRNLLHDEYDQTWLDVKALESITPI